MNEIKGIGAVGKGVEREVGGRVKQVPSDNDASELDLWNILGHFGTIRKTLRRVRSI